MPPLNEIAQWPRDAWNAITALIIAQVVRFKLWRHRRRMEKQTYLELLDRFEAHLPSSHPPLETGMEIYTRKELRKAARKMAQKAPRGLLPMSQLLEEPIAASPAPESVPSTPVVRTAAEDDSTPAEVVKPHAGASEPGKTAAQVWSGIRKQTLQLIGVVREPKRANPVKLRLTTDEVLATERLTDASVTLVPKPRSAEVQKIDTAVTGYWESNPNAVEEVQLAARLPLVHNQIREIIQHLITSRPSIQGPPEMVEHIRRWIEFETEHNTDHERGLDRFITDLTKQMLYYGTGALIKQRTLSASVDAIKDPLKGTRRAPVWGYAIPDMSTLEVFIDDRGRPRKWRQAPGLFQMKKLKEYPAEDVFVTRLPTQNSSLYFWTPSFIMPALYAVTVLRDLQATIDAHTRSIVDILYYAQVGDAKYMDGRVTETMVSKITGVLNRAPRRSTPVVPWYVKLEKLQLDEYIGQLTDAADFWEREVRRGVGGSQLQDGVGDSSTRNTSDALTEKEMRAAQALVPELQRAFRWLTYDKLLEMPGFDPKKITSWADLPSLEFEEIDMTQQIRRETHYVQLWQTDGLKHGEYRKAIGRDVDTEKQDQYMSDIMAEKADSAAGTQFDNTLRLEKEKAKIKSQTAPGGTPRPKRAQK